MEYGSTPYVGMAGTKSYVQNSALIIVIRFHETHHDISSVFISNKTVSAARKLRWSTRPASRHTVGAWPNRTSSLFLLSSARLAQ